jgi:hypothetical protein
VCLGARDAFTVRIVSELHTEEGPGQCLLVVLFTVVVTLYLSPLAPSTFVQQVNGLVRHSKGNWWIPTSIGASPMNTSIGVTILALI